ncbi:MAG: hypothetical protein AB7I41_02565 [Candidatus Sericytochromatia bacterium]
MQAGTTPLYNPYNMGFPGTVPTTTPSGGVSIASSPQLSPNMVMDGVEIGLKSLIVGRMASKTAIQQLEFRTIQNNEASAAGVMGSTMMRTLGKGALVGGVVSAARNVFHLAQGEINVARAGGNVSADILGGAVGGLAAGAGAGLAVGMMAKSSGFTMGTMGLIAGTIGFALADTLYHYSGLRATVSDKVTSVIERFFDSNSQGGGV